MTPKPLDFQQVDLIRRRMLLTVKDMSDLFGVTRATYYGWLNGKPIRKSNDEVVRVMLRRLLSVVSVHKWPTKEVLAAEQKQRKDMLLALLNQQ